jgi:hypothetical protein
MTPLKAGCPASSELLRSSSRSQGIPGGGVSDGAIWPLSASLFLCTLNKERWDEGPFLSCQGALEGGEMLFRKVLCDCAQLWSGRKGLDESEVPAKTYFLVLT